MCTLKKIAESVFMSLCFVFNQLIHFGRWTFWRLDVSVAENVHKAAFCSTLVVGS